MSEETFCAHMMVNLTVEERLDIEELNVSREAVEAAWLHIDFRTRPSTMTSWNFAVKRIAHWVCTLDAT